MDVGLAIGDLAVTKHIKPQAGPQEAFLSSSADITIFGGTAGAGKTMALLMESVRHVGVKGFTGVIFRRTSPQIKSGGGLWDTSEEIYPYVGGIPTPSFLKWDFPNGNAINFKHLEYDKNVNDWQGSQLAFIAFDELTHFTEKQFFYMLSRNRSMCGIRPYMRATCNPDADHFLVKGPNGWGSGLISWWIDERGDPIPERSGVIRWFIRYNEHLHFADTAEELLEQYPKLIPKSLTFVPAKLSDNKILEKADPGYRANLMAQSILEKRRLLDGNWKARADSGSFFKREWFGELITKSPSWSSAVRAWDLAASEPSPGYNDPDWTAGLKMVVRDGMYYIVDLRKGQIDSGDVEKLAQTTAQTDGLTVPILIPQDPGQAGKAQVEHYKKRVLPQYKVIGTPVTSNKEVRAAAFSAACKNGLVKVVRADWNFALFDQLDPFPMKGVHDDFVDAAADAFNYLSQKSSGNYAGFDSPAHKSKIPSFSGGRGGLPGL